VRNAGLPVKESGMKNFWKYFWLIVFGFGTALLHLYLKDYQHISQSGSYIYGIAVGGIAKIMFDMFTLKHNARE
jgi:hypothetical protein